MVASNMIDGGTIILIFLVLAACIALCAGLIFMALWLTSKINGSKGLVWGAILGVVIANFFPLLGSLVGQVPFSFLYQSFLPKAVAASLVACLINLILWQLRPASDPPAADRDTQRGQ